MRRLEVSLRPGRAERSSPPARGGPRWSAGVRGGPCQAPRLGTDLRGPPCAAVDRLFSARKTAVTRERGVASGRSRAPRNRLGGAEPVAPCPGRWAAPRPRGGPPKVRIRRKKWEKNIERRSNVRSNYCLKYVTRIKFGQQSEFNGFVELLSVLTNVRSKKKNSEQCPQKWVDKGMSSHWVTQTKNTDISPTFSDCCPSDC